jgi:hypothetical protein
MAAPTYLDLGALLGRTVTPEQGAAVLQVVTAMASSYTRGVGFVDGVPSDEIKFGAIIPAAARLISHARQIGMSESLGPQGVDYRTGFTGWSLAERFVLDRHRVRAV